MSIFLKMPREIMLEIANKARDKRLSMNLSQKTMVERSGVKYGTIKKFEQTGKISLESLLKIASALGELERFDQLFTVDLTKFATLAEIMRENTRKRGRK